MLAYHLGRLLQMPPHHPQVPGQVVLFQERQAVAPLGVLQAARLSAHAVVRAVGDDGLGADAAHQGEFLVLGQDLLGVRRVDPGMGDDGVGHAVACSHLGQPSALGDLLAAVALGLHVHGGDDIVQRRVAAVLRRQVGPAQGGVVAHVGMLPTGEPRIAQLALEVPEVVVGIDDGQVVVHASLLHRCFR